MPEKYENPNIKIDLSKLKVFTKRVESALERTSRTLAARGAEEMIQNITINDQIDTGAMRASVFFQTYNDAKVNYQRGITEATAAAKIPGKKTGRTFDFKKKINAIEWEPGSIFESKVGISAEYAKWQEWKHLKFLYPAFQTVRAESKSIFNREMRSEIKSFTPNRSLNRVERFNLRKV